MLADILMAGKSEAGVRFLKLRGQFASLLIFAGGFFRQTRSGRRHLLGLTLSALVYVDSHLTIFLHEMTYSFQW
jgi:hypothetical protein